MPRGPQRDAVYVAAPGLKVGLAGHLLNAAAEAAYAGVNRMGRVGTTLIASRLAAAAQNVTMVAVDAPGATYSGIADELRHLADMVEQIGQGHPATEDGRSHAE